MKFTMTLVVSVESTDQEAENTIHVKGPMNLRKKNACNTERALATVSQILYVTDGGLF